MEPTSNLRSQVQQSAFPAGPGPAAEDVFLSAPITRPLPAHVRVVTELSEFLPALRDPAVNLALWDRGQDWLSERLSDLMRNPALSFNFRFSGKRSELSAAFTRYIETLALPSDVVIGLQSLTENLSEFFTSLSGGQQVQVVLHSVDNPWLSQGSANRIAQRLHYEAGIPLNLVLTLCGQGTQYVANENVRRWELYRLQNANGEYPAEAVLHDPQALYQMPTNAIAVMKGELVGAPGERGSTPMLRRFNSGNGLVHRGVDLAEGERRLRLNVFSTQKPPYIPER